MSLADTVEYECVRCGYQDVAEDALVGTCQRCGNEMRNVELIRD